MAIGMGSTLGDVQAGLGGLSVLYAIFGIVYSVIGWVFLLALAEVLHLLVDLERNTRETADRLRVGSIDKSA